MKNIFIILLVFLYSCDHPKPTPKMESLSLESEIKKSINIQPTDVSGVDSIYIIMYMDTIK